MTEKLMEVHDVLWIVGCVGCLAFMVAWVVWLAWCNVKVRRICETEPGPPEPVESYTFVGESLQGEELMYVTIWDSDHQTDEPIWEGNMAVLPANGQKLLVRGQYVRVEQSVLCVENGRADIYARDWDPPDPDAPA